MKEIKNVEMANDSQIFEIKTGGQVEIIPDGEGWSITVAGEEMNYYHTRQQAETDLQDYAIDPHLVITGYGINSGRKFWQLPEPLKEEIIAWSNNG